MGQLPPIRVGLNAVYVDAFYYADHHDVQHGNARREGWVFTDRVWVPLNNSRVRAVRLELYGRFRPTQGDPRLATARQIGTVELPTWEVERLADVRDDPTVGKMNADLPPELRR